MDESQFLEELKKDFYDEAHSLIEMLESNILVIENDPTNEEAINEIFRAAHTLKGGSSTLDLDRIANFTHEMENLLEEVRSGNIKLNPDLVDLLLKSIDIVKKLIITSQEGKEQPPGFEDSIIEAIKQASKALDVPPTQVSSQSPITKPSSEQFKNKIDFVLNEYERYLIKKAPLEGYKVYEVYVKFNDSNPMRTVSGLQIHSQLKEISDVLKSIPDIDDLMSDYFQEEAIFITQSTSSSTEIYNKVFISDVTDFIEVNEFTEEVEEETSESLGGALNLTPEDLQEIQNHILAGKKVYKILITFDESNPMRSVSGVLFFTMLRTKGEILKCVPSYEDFKKDTFYPNGEFIFASTHSSKDLRNKLYLSDVTKELKFQEFQKENGKQTDFKIKQEEIKKTEVIPEKIFEPEKAKQKELVTPKTIDDTLKVAPVSKQSVSATMDEGADSSVERKQIASVLRVESSRIDEMLNLVGELVIIKASFMQINEKNSFILDELSSTFNQYKQNTRVLMGEVEEFIENYALQANHSSTSKTMSSNDLDSDGKYDLDKSKEYFASRFESLFGFFDSVIPQYKSMQEKLKNSSQHLGRITDDLQESVMKVRMVPINQIFSRFPRLIRDISKNLNKKINLDMQGEETELDKSVIEDLVDPLVHIVRNAVDHGIESPKERADLGKDPTGNVLLKAEHEGNTVTITVKDDGRGINLDKVRKKAIESRLIDSNQEVSKEELINLIFHPGFSTAKEVTSLSGRGVGMDVVRRKIENIGGVVEIQSEESKGSTFKIKIPLTLAIIQALLVQVDKYIYSIPINSVIETLRIGPEDIEILENTEVIRVREEVLSLVQLNRLFKHKTTESNDEYFYVIVVGTSNKKVGLGVDNLVGEQDIVIKPLNNKYTNVQGIAGATILGDGQVSLVLDVSDIFALIASQKRHLLFVK